MRRFWVGLWWRWALWVTLISLLWAAGASVLLTFGLYLYKGMPPLEKGVVTALGDIARFGFPVFWCFAFLAAFFRSVRRLFGHCIDHFRLTLLSCDGETRIENPGSADTVRVWRKWFFVIIWAVAAEVIVAALLHFPFASGGGAMGWFSLYWLYLFVLLAALATLPLMGARCPFVKVERC